MKIGKKRRSKSITCMDRIGEERVRCGNTLQEILVGDANIKGCCCSRSSNKASEKK